MQSFQSMKESILAYLTKGGLAAVQARPQDAFATIRDAIRSMGEAAAVSDAKTLADAMTNEKSLCSQQCVSDDNAGASMTCDNHRKYVAR